MSSNALSRRLVLIAAVVLGAGAAVAYASGGGAAGPVRAHVVRGPMPAVAAPGRRAAALRAPAAAAVMPALPGMPAPICRPRPKRAPSARKPPSEALKDTFEILRSEREDEDALPAKALAALRSQGLEPVDVESARLLRADGDARAWVAPVPDVGAAARFGCAPSTEAIEGLAVVALGGAPAGGGGGLRELQRGIAPVSIDPCAGAGHDMLGVSGIVPDGVEAVFVTAADGTATRADVRDNGYVFVLPRSDRIELRYVVWTGPDGVPHVQPLPSVFARREVCARVATTSTEPPPHITPDGLGVGCSALATLPPAAPPPILRVPGAPPRLAIVPKRAPRNAPPLAAPMACGLAIAARAAVPPVRGPSIMTAPARPKSPRRP